MTFQYHHETKSLTQKASMMPVLGIFNREYKGLEDVPVSVPMAMLDEKQADYVHSQTLERLAERGGMGIGEILNNIQKSTAWTYPINQVAVNVLNNLIKKYIESISINALGFTPSHEGRELVEGVDFRLETQPVEGWTPTYNNPDDPPTETFAIPIVE